jgi:transcription antitermination factor NusG
LHSEFIPVFASEVVLEGANHLPWYGVRTMSNCEKVASAVLKGKGYEQYLPLHRVRRRRSDRVVQTESPLFPGYVFCRFDAARRLPIMTTPGVVSILGFGKTPVPVPDSEIEAIQAIVRSGMAAEPCPFLQEGQGIRVQRGSLEGLEGILLKKKTEWRMVVSLTMLQRSLSVEIDRDSITAM